MMKLSMSFFIHSTNIPPSNLYTSWWNSNEWNIDSYVLHSISSPLDYQHLENIVNFNNEAPHLSLLRKPQYSYQLLISST